MKKMKKLIPVILALILTIGVIGGCSSVVHAGDVFGGIRSNIKKINNGIDPVGWRIAYYIDLPFSFVGDVALLPVASFKLILHELDWR